MDGNYRHKLQAHVSHLPGYVFLGDQHYLQALMDTCDNRLHLPYCMVPVLHPNAILDLKPLPDADIV